MAHRILHVIPAVAPRYGGPSAAVLGLCRAARALGASTLIVTTDADGPGRLEVPLERVHDFGGVPTVFFHRQFTESFKWSRGLSAWLHGHVGEFDVVHVHAVFSHSSIAAGRACRAARVPYIVRPLGTLDPWSVNRKWLRKQVLFRAGVADLLAGAAAIHYTSEAERALAEPAVAPAGRGVVVPLGIDDELFGDARGDLSSAGTPYVLALSRLDMKKGLDLLIQAFADAASPPAGAPWRLVIAGDGPAAYVSSLRALIDASPQPVRARIALRGWVAGADKIALLRGAAVFAAPSHQENFGISVVEAMACGVPAIVTPGVNLADAIRDAGAGWLAERSRAGVAAALIEAMADRDEARRRGVRARAFAERFRWAAIGRRLMAMYDAAAGIPPMAAVVGL